MRVPESLARSRQLLARSNLISDDAILIIGFKHILITGIRRLFLKHISLLRGIILLGYLALWVKISLITSVIGNIIWLYVRLLLIFRRNTELNLLSINF